MFFGGCAGPWLINSQPPTSLACWSEETSLSGRCAQAGCELTSWRLAPCPKALPLMSTDTMVQRIALCSGNAQTRGAHEGGPRFSEFPRLPTWRCGPGMPLRAEGKDSRNFERPNLKAQASKLSQNRERVHSGWQPFSQVHDAFKRSVPQELSRLSQVVQRNGLRPIRRAHTKSEATGSSANTIRPRLRGEQCSGPLPSMPMIPSAMTKCARTAALISRMLRSMPFQCSRFFGQP